MSLFISSSFSFSGHKWNDDSKNFIKRIANVKHAGMIPTQDAILRRSGLITANNASLLQVATALVSPVDYQVFDSSYGISKYNTVLLESCVQFCYCCTCYRKFKHVCTFHLQSRCCQSTGDIHVERMHFCVDVNNVVPKRGSARCAPPLLEFIQQVSLGGFRRTKKKAKNTEKR